MKMTMQVTEKYVYTYNYIKFGQFNSNSPPNI